MLIYDINPKDGTALNPAGREAPLEPMRQQPRIPAGATDIKPPKPGEYQAAHFTDGAWELVPDYRGHIYYTEDGQRHEIMELGAEPPADALEEAPPEPLADVADRKKREIVAASDTAFAAGLAYDIAGESDIVQTRPQDQINLLGLNAKAQRLIAAGDTNTLMDFRGESNVTRKLNATEMDLMTMTALAHIEGVYQRSWERKDAIRAALEAEDREALEAIAWSEG